MSTHADYADQSADYVDPEREGVERDADKYRICRPGGVNMCLQVPSSANAVNHWGWRVYMCLQVLILLTRWKGVHVPSSADNADQVHYKTRIGRSTSPARNDCLGPY